MNIGFDWFLPVVGTAAFLATSIVLLAIRWVYRPALNKVAFNERLKLMAAGFDRASTACFIAAFVTPESRLSQLNMGTSTDVKAILIVSIWIFAAIALHLFAGNLLTRIKDQ